MKKVSAIFTVASGVFAVVPGVAVLTSNLGVPPNSSVKLFAGVIESLGVLTVMMLWLNKEWIKGLSTRQINKLAFGAIALFFIALSAYIFLFNYLVVKVPDTEAVFFPFWSNGDVKTYLLKFGSREELINRWGKDDVVKQIQKTSEIPLMVTTLVLLAIYQLTFVSLTFSFGLLGIKTSQRNRNSS